jgi:hypothetical protein
MRIITTIFIILISATMALGWGFGGGGGSSLPNVTNDAQTKAAIVPNTVPSAGQILIGNAGGTAYAPVSVTGDITLSSAGSTLVTKINGVTYSLDPLAQYVILAGRSGGQTINGGTGAGDPLHLKSTSNSTKGYIDIDSPLYTPTPYSNGTCTTALTVAAINGPLQRVTLTDTNKCVLSFTQPATGTARIVLRVMQSSAGAFSGTIGGANCYWGGGVVMTPTMATGAIDFISIYMDGTNTYCAPVLQNAALGSY